MSRRPPATRARIEPEVDESRAGDVRVARRSPRCEVHSPDQVARDLLRLPLERLRERHREVRRPLAERRIARALEHGATESGAPSVAGCASQLVADEIRCAHSLSPPFVLLDADLRLRALRRRPAWASLRSMPRLLDGELLRLPLSLVGASDADDLRLRRRLALRLALRLADPSLIRIELDPLVRCAFLP